MKIVLRRLEGPVVCENCFVADRAPARMKGLLGRRNLPSGEGLLLRPASSVHTFFMRFPIDILLLDADNRIVAIRPEVPPWRMVGARGARAVLELAAGEAQRRGLSVGARLEPALEARGDRRLFRLRATRA